MKKLFSALLAGVMLTFTSVGVYAADDTTIEIKTAKYDSTSEKVKVTGVINNAADSQSITVMSTGIKTDDTYDADEIVYIDQNDDVQIGENGSFSLDFYLSDSAQKEKRYYVRVGGTGISSPVYMGFLFSDSGEVEIVYGDISGDGTVDVNDAVMLLNYILNPASETISEKGFKNAQIRKEPIQQGEFTASDVAMILQKAVDATFDFPAEK